MTAGQARGPLPMEGVRVLDMTRYVAGPHCAMMLADFGAEVVRIERPGRGEDLRSSEPRWQGENLFMMTLNRNKKSVTIDLYKPEGQALLRDLVSKADVLVENFRPGTMEKMGCGWDALRAVNPRLVMARISGFGQDGPYVGKPAFDVIAQAMSGLMHSTGQPDGPPTMAGSVVVDYTTGIYAALGIAMALRARDQTGVGQVVDCTLLDSAVSLLMGWIPEKTIFDKSAGRNGNRDRYAAPGNTFQSSDKAWVHIITSSDKQFANLCAIMGRPELARDPRYATIGARLREIAALEHAVAEWAATRTAEEIVALMERADVPCAKVATIEDVLENPQLRHRGQIVEVEHPAGGKVAVQGPPIRLSETPASVRSGVPAVGQHTDDVLRDWLGGEEQDIRRLREGGVIG